MTAGPGMTLAALGVCRHSQMAGLVEAGFFAALGLISKPKTSGVSGVGRRLFKERRQESALDLGRQLSCVLAG